MPTMNAQALMFLLAASARLESTEAFIDHDSCNNMRQAIYRDKVTTACEHEKDVCGEQYGASTPSILSFGLNAIGMASQARQEELSAYNALTPQCQVALDRRERTEHAPMMPCTKQRRRRQVMAEYNRYFAGHCTKAKPCS